MQVLITTLLVGGAALLLILVVAAQFHREYRKTPSGQTPPASDATSEPSGDQP